MIQSFLSTLALFATKAYAHVGYVVGQKEFAEHLGHDEAYVLSPLYDIKNILLIGATILGVFVLYFVAWRVPWVRTRIIVLRARLDTYGEFVPWILRLSLGIAFIGASAAHVLVSPVLQTGLFAWIELLVGFALLAGFLVVPATILGVLLYIIAISYTGYIAGNAEVAMALIALLILGSARPGLDDLFGVPEIHAPSLKKYVPLLLRIGIGGSLIFLSLYEKILNPHVSELVVQKYHLTSIIHVGPAMWVFAVGIIELAVGLCLLIGFQTRLVSAVAFLVLATTFFFFKEEVYSHVTLFGVLSVLFITSAGPFSIDSLLKKR